MKSFLKLFMCFAFIISTNVWADYKLGEGDFIRVMVYGDNDLTRELRISENGYISLPLVGVLDINQLTAIEAEQKIAEKLNAGGYIKNPQVSVVITQFFSKSVSVIGGVLKSGRYPLLRNTTVSDIIAEAGGLVPDASDIVTVISGDQRTSINLSEYAGKGKDNQNLKLTGGETILVSSRDVSVLGNVLRPGKYGLQGEFHRLSDFISMAGGLTEFASHKILYYSNHSGTTVSREIDLDAFFKKYNGLDDIEIFKGDIIYIPQADVFYAYGEVQKPGIYKIDKNLNVMQALAKASGLTPKGSQRTIVLHRKNENGEVIKTKANLLDTLKNEDVIFVEESLF